MSTDFEVPRTKGQLIWCPADPALGVGVVTRVEGNAVWVRFLRLQEERAYTTRRADCAITRYRISKGERVRNGEGRELRVRSIVGDGEGELATYELDDGSQVEELDLVPEIRDVGAKERLATLNLVHPEVVRARVGGLDLATLGRRPGHAAILGARVEWLPHQIDVAARATESEPVRLLLADEVGLGKTVEAALIYAALSQEGRASRVLVLAPDALCIQWLGELYRKVHELFVLIDEARIEDAEQDFPELGPFEVYRRCVASIDQVAGDELLAEEAVAVDWDLVVVDEAHHLRWRAEGGGNPAYNLLERLSKKTRHLLLLTATPMALDPTEYHALLRLLDPARFDDPATFETVQQRVSVIREVARSLLVSQEQGKPLGKAVVKAALEVLGDDPADRKLFEKLGATKPKDPEYGELAEGVLEALQQRHGLADHVIRNRRGPVGGLPQRFPETFALTPTDSQAMLVEIGESVMFELASTLPEGRMRNQTLGQMLRALWATPRALTEVLEPISPDLVEVLAPHIQKVTDAPLDQDGLPTGDARLCWLVKVIRELPEGDKLLVFVESPIAVKALRDALEPIVGADIAMFHRGLAPRDQDRQVAWFRDPNGPQLMLSTEAGGEGRNFQFCHRVVLYDLPWRPATIEQRIGRVDRVGQRHDVHVLVPHFKSGYEAAILKVMQESIGVLDGTVGGIDPVLEYVSDQIAELIFERAGVDRWKQLFLSTEDVVKKARFRIEEGVDPILDHTSFSNDRVMAVLGRAPEDLEERTEAFVQRFADSANIEVRVKGGALVDVDGAPSASSSEERDGGYVGTFSRTEALDHEDVEFLSFGHPFVERALEWANSAVDASAALALCRGFKRDSAVFIWRFGIDLPDDVPEASAYFESYAHTFAIDESGKEQPELVSLLTTTEKPLDRMDPGPLKSALPRWRALVEQNFGIADNLARDAVDKSCANAQARLAERIAQRHRNLKRSQVRELNLIGDDKDLGKQARKRHKVERAEIDADAERLKNAVSNVTPRLIAVVAVRMMRIKQASA